MKGTLELRSKVFDIAQAHGLDPRLICAMVEQESDWNPFALRPESESGFMQRYGEAYGKIVKASASKFDDHWIRFEDVFYCSYGLLQTMYPVVIEMVPEIAANLRFPTELCDPAIGIAAGCMIFKKKMRAANNDVTKALLFWNGGGNPAYPDEVLARLGNY